MVCNRFYGATFYKQNRRFAPRVVICPDLFPDSIRANMVYDVETKTKKTVERNMKLMKRMAVMETKRTVLMCLNTLLWLLM